MFHVVYVVMIVMSMKIVLPMTKKFGVSNRLLCWVDKQLLLWFLGWYTGCFLF